MDAVADPVLNFHCNIDPDPTFQCDADPDPAHQSYASLQSLVYIHHLPAP